MNCFKNTTYQILIKHYIMNLMVSFFEADNIAEYDIGDDILCLI
jgi:hypothetical protein